MPRFTPAASATSRIERPAQPRRARSSRPAARSARSRLREGRGIGDITIRMSSNRRQVSFRLSMASVSATQAEAERALAEQDLARGEAERALARLVPLDRAGDDEATFLMARIEQGLGRFAAARERLLALRARMGTTTPPLELELASVCQRLGDPPAALAALQAAIALKPDIVAAHKNLVAILAAQGRMEEVREALRRAVAEIPYEASLWVRYAAIHQHFGDGEGALSCLEKAVLSMPA